MKKSSDLRIIVLGAAAGGGLPQWNCGCLNCTMARDPGSAVRPQSQSSLAVSLDGEAWAVFNASPDIRQQIEDNRLLQPRRLRHTPIKSVVLTNGDIDHLAGLLVLREKQPLTVFSTSSVGEIIADNPVFGVLDPDLVARRSVVIEEAFSPLPDLEARLFAVPGKVPLFLEEGEPDLNVEGENTVGIELRAGNERVYYIPGCAMINDALAARLRDADALFFDGTLFTDREMIATGTGRKTGRRMGHMPISGDGGSLDALEGLNIRRKVYIHINNTNPIWRAGPERAAVENRGFEVGFDGMEIRL
ncbi:pyrroloquinoline quinone biosynthesis protein PqqB [Sinorhizobium mexicanum]|uniref:Coenzyme PQQ synthesis protein B n=1 Tax=Sinorhizobium mexicanum TaxID=375549 RepID=A0A859QJG8_9HYPH|nr:pyrroloquinoline quinone biosynthesis protein PqqB [Sinorhizobium mexicanum]MBP1888044.1 pyrroloquinoline quinone biosynthesis protein B [Sinorhizobium mexicanum]QLL66082.1 pyrroloquinoline quinone biosynthesis protein PqqB [Sinorhizobium mexicanum]